MDMFLILLFDCSSFIIEFVFVKAFAKVKIQNKSAKKGEKMYIF